MPSARRRASGRVNPSTGPSSTTSRKASWSSRPARCSTATPEWARSSTTALRSWSSSSSARVFIPTTGTTHSQRLSAMFEQGSPGMPFEVRLVTKSGDTRTVGAHATVIEWQGEPAVIVFIEDITERKRAEADQEMRRELVKILDEAGDASDLFSRLIDRIRTSTGFDAVGIRLRGRRRRLSLCRPAGLSRRLPRDREHPARTR